MKINATTLTTTIELTEKEEQIIHLGLSALAGLFKTINDDDNDNPFHVKVTLDEIVKLEEKLLVKLMEDNKAALAA
jgi:hypothetical protein